MKILTPSLFAALAVGAGPAVADTFAYVSLGGENKIAIYRVDPDRGTLTRTGETNLSGAPGALAVDPQKRYLFASIRSNNSLGSFRIDPATGALTPINTVNAGTNAAYVGADQSGRYLLSAYYQAGKAMVHAIGPDGSLSAEPVQVVETAPNAHSTIPDPQNRWVFVPHTGPNAIYQFRFNPATGKLTPNLEPKVEPPTKTGPRHLRFHPRKPVAYTSDELGSSISAFSLEPRTGRLTRFQTLSTLPAEFQGRNTTAEVKVHPTGHFVYVSNRGHDSIAGFRIQDSGAVEAIGQAPTEKTPRSFDIDPSGRYLYSAGQGTTRLAAYRIDPKTGTLERFETYEVGKQPSWVTVVTLR